MKKTVLFGIAAGVLILGSGALFALTQTQQPARRLVTGQIQCLYCYASEADMGSDPNGCVVRCSTKKDLPLTLVEEGTGEAYVAVWKNGESPIARLTPLVGKKVNAQGPVWQRGGIKVIEIQIISEAI